MPLKGQETEVIVRLQAKTRYEGNCYIWTGKLVGHGYGEVWYKGRGIRLGRLVCHLFHGADLNDNSWTANHTRDCTNNACWNPAHLYVGTQAENVQDQIAMGKFHYGTQNLNGGGNYDKEKTVAIRRANWIARNCEPSTHSGDK